MGRPKKNHDEHNQMMLEGVHTVDRHKQRIDMADLSEEDISKIADVAWMESRMANCIIRNGEGRGHPSSWASCNARTKQRAVVDFVGSVFVSHEFRKRFVKAALEDPLTVAKLYFSTLPKDVEVSVNQQVGIVILPGKAGSVADWMEMAKGEKVIDGEVIGQEGQDAAETWKKILETNP